MAGSVNKVILVGNLGRDPEVRMTQGGQKIANLNIATSESRFNKQTEQREESTEWHRLVVFGKSAEVVEKYLTKGSKAYFEGRLQTRKWNDKDGQERFTTEIVVDNFTILDSKNDNQSGDKGTRAVNQAPAPRAISTDAPFDDEIPF